MTEMCTNVKCTCMKCFTEHEIDWNNVHTKQTISADGNACEIFGKANNNIKK